MPTAVTVPVFEKTTITGPRRIGWTAAAGNLVSRLMLAAGKCALQWQPPQEEVHRFSITYQKSFAGKASKKARFPAYRGWANSGSARPAPRTRHHRQDPPGGWEELAQVVPHNVAVSIRNYFDGEGQRTEETT